MGRFAHDREEFWDAPIKGEGCPSRWAFNLIVAAAFILFKICFRYKVEGREHLDLGEGKAAVIAGNHSSLADPLLLILAVPNHICRFLCKEELLNHDANSFVAQGITRMGAFPIKRGTADMTAIRRATACLKRGENVGIFPEGTRVKDLEDKTAEHFGGAVLIANAGKSPIVPVGIEGADRIKPPGSKFLHFPKITIRFGAPIWPKDYNYLPKAERVQACIEDVMKRSYELRSGKQPALVETADDKDAASSVDDKDA